MEKCYPCPPLSFFTSKKTQVFFVRYDIVKKYDMEKCSLIIKKKTCKKISDTSSRCPQQSARNRTS